MCKLKEWTASEIEEYDDSRLELAEEDKIECTRVYIKEDVDKVIAELEESHKKEVEQLRMKIAGLQEKLKEQTSIAEEGWKEFRTYHTSYAEAVKELYDKNKEIAELKEKHKTEVKELLYLIRDKNNNFNRAFDSEEKEIRRHKYKRCLDNAWGCRQRMELFHELVLEEARTIALPNEVALKEYRRKRERAAKWRKRWLKIAEQFKDKEA